MNIGIGGERGKPRGAPRDERAPDRLAELSELKNKEARHENANINKAIRNCIEGSQQTLDGSHLRA